MKKPFSKLIKISDVVKKYKIPKEYIEKRIKSGHLTLSATSKSKYIYEEELRLDMTNTLYEYIRENKLIDLFSKAFETAYALDLENEALINELSMSRDIIERRKSNKVFFVYKDIDNPKKMWLKDDYNGIHAPRVVIPFLPNNGIFTKYYKDFLFTDPIELSSIEPDEKLFNIRDLILNEIDESRAIEINAETTRKLKTLFFYHFVLGKSCEWRNDDF
jgi:hypothetical protein